MIFRYYRILPYLEDDGTVPVEDCEWEWAASVESARTQEGSTCRCDAVRMLSDTLARCQFDGMQHGPMAQFGYLYWKFNTRTNLHFFNLVTGNISFYQVICFCAVVILQYENKPFKLPFSHPIVFFSVNSSLLFSHCFTFQNETGGG